MNWLFQDKKSKLHIEHAIRYYQARNLTSKQHVNVYLDSHVQRC